MLSFLPLPLPIYYTYPLLAHLQLSVPFARSLAVVDE